MARSAQSAIPPRSPSQAVSHSACIANEGCPELDACPPPLDILTMRALDFLPNMGTKRASNFDKGPHNSKAETINVGPHL